MDWDKIVFNTLGIASDAEWGPALEVARWILDNVEEVE